jgi:hypothetical protein
MIAGLFCWECVADDEDSAPWCDCRSGEGCKGPCRQRAHTPDRCPTPGRWRRDDG